MAAAGPFSPLMLRPEARTLGQPFHPQAVISDSSCCASPAQTVCPYTPHMASQPSSAHPCLESKKFETPLRLGNNLIRQGSSSHVSASPAFSSAADNTPSLSYISTPRTRFDNSPIPCCDFTPPNAISTRHTRSYSTSGPIRSPTHRRLRPAPYPLNTASYHRRSISSTLTHPNRNKPPILHSISDSVVPQCPHSSLVSSPMSMSRETPFMLGGEQSTQLLCPAHHGSENQWTESTTGHFLTDTTVYGSSAEGTFYTYPPPFLARRSRPRTPLPTFLPQSPHAYPHSVPQSCDLVLTKPTGDEYQIPQGLLQSPSTTPCYDTRPAYTHNSAPTAMPELNTSVWPPYDGLSQSTSMVTSSPLQLSTPTQFGCCTDQMAYEPEQDQEQMTEPPQHYDSNHIYPFLPALMANPIWPSEVTTQASHAASTWANATLDQATTSPLFINRNGDTQSTSDPSKPQSLTQRFLASPSTLNHGPGVTPPAENTYRHSPSQTDFTPDDEDMRPIRLQPLFEGDVYTPRWKRRPARWREKLKAFEGWCGICGVWLNMKTSRYQEHMQMLHGFNPVTKRPFQGPVGIRWVEAVQRRRGKENDDTRRYDGTAEAVGGVIEDWPRQDAGLGLGMDLSIGPDDRVETLTGNGNGGVTTQEGANADVDMGGLLLKSPGSTNSEDRSGFSESQNQHQDHQYPSPLTMMVATPYPPKTPSQILDRETGDLRRKPPTPTPRAKEVTSPLTSQKREGLCGRCGLWIDTANRKHDWGGWFGHAMKVRSTLYIYMCICAKRVEDDIVADDCIVPQSIRQTAEKKGG